MKKKITIGVLLLASFLLHSCSTKIHVITEDGVRWYTDKTKENIDHTGTTQGN
jgi:PBP1b-binding outer membrane lipoprotein LpoB